MKKSYTKRLDTFINPLVHTSTFIALAATLSAYSSTIVLGYNLNFTYYFTIFLLYLSIYNINKKTDQKEDKLNHELRVGYHTVFGEVIYFISILALFGSLTYFLSKGLFAFILALIPPIVVILYSVPLFPKGLEKILKAKRLKEIFIIKNVIVGVTWSSSMTFLQADILNQPIDISVLSLFLIIATFFSVNTAVFDMRDIQGDKKFKIKTLPVVYGEKYTKKILGGINLVNGIFILIVVYLGVLNIIGGFLIFNVIYTFGYLYLFGKVDKNIICDIFVDGEYLLMAVYLTIVKLIII